MADLQNKFTFTWQIQNFSMCPLKSNEKLTSPVFTVAILGYSKWHIGIHPKACSLACYLTCNETGLDVTCIQTCFKFALFSEDGNKIISKQSKDCDFKRNSNWGYPNFFSRAAIFDDRKAYLPNDTLTIKCYLWRIDKVDRSGITSELRNEILPNDIKSHILNLELSNECSVVTRIEVQRKTISWPIRNFGSVSYNESLVTRVSSALDGAPSFRIALFKSIEKQSLEIEIQEEESAWTFAKCKVSVLQTPRDVEYYAEDYHLFEPDDVWKFPSFIKLAKLREEQYLKKTSDILHLYFEISFSYTEDIHHIEKDDFRQYGSLTNVSEPIEEFVRMYKEADAFDVVIRASDRHFKVLKSILKARSPVFGAMFDNDMREKESGVVIISDIDPDTLDRLLGFMYSNALEDLEAEDAIKLYRAADKYQVDSLKHRCAWILASSMSLSNVCEVLNLADQHDDDYLRDCVERLVQVNPRTIFESQNWEHLITTNPKLAATVMHKVLKS